VGVRVAYRCALLLIGVLVFLEKVCKLFIILQFLLFHGDNLVDKCLEILQMIHQLLLVSHEIVDGGSVLS
jgi:hypothetical protein